MTRLHVRILQVLTYLPNLEMCVAGNDYDVAAADDGSLGCALCLSTSHMTAVVPGPDSVHRHVACCWP